MKLSIIIPVYNVERYIERCLASIVNDQNLDASLYEIIVVNDGTKDNSMEIVEKYAKRHSNISVINQKNQGLSVARNTGMKAAQGDYLWFIDSDDWITENSIRSILSALKNNIDILQLQYQLCYEDGRIEAVKPCVIKSVVSGVYQTLRGGVDVPAQFSIYRRQFLFENNFEFYPGVYHEDVEFKPRVLLAAQGVCSLPLVCYNYFQRTSGSITAQFKLRNGIDMLTVLNRLYEFVEPYEKDVKKAIYAKISMWMNSIIRGIRQLENEDYSTLCGELRHNNNLFYAMRHSGNLFYYIEGVLLGINVKFGLKMLSII